MARKTRATRYLAKATIAAMIAGSALSVGGAPLVAATAACSADFNGDSKCDLAVAAPLEDVAGATNAGSVSVIYGGVSDLSVTGDQLLHQNTTGAPEAGELDDQAELEDRYGSALAVGDFNGDTFSDLAVGVPYEDVGGIKNTGAVDIIYGSSSGLEVSTNELLHQNTTDVVDSNEAEDRWGTGLAAGDFDGDGVSDLAVGAPLENTDGKTNNGSVTVLYGSSGSPLGGVGSQLWSQNWDNGTVDTADDIADAVESDDQFGSAVAAGDLNGDTFDDLIVSAPLENMAISGTTYTDNGGVHVILGSASGLTGVDSTFDHQSSAAGTTESNDRFGTSLASGDFDGDGDQDLAVGTPYEDGAATANIGSVALLRLDAGDITGVEILQSSIAEVGEAEDRFGWTLATGDFDGDTFADLALGTPFENVTVGATTYSDAGLVQVISGSGAGLALAGVVAHHQGTAADAVEDIVEGSDRFGQALHATDINNDNVADLVVGVPLENTPILDGGLIQVMPGSVGGLDTTADKLWHTNVLGLLEGSETGDQWGTALA